MTMLKKLFALSLCLALLTTATLSVAAKPASTVTFAFETVAEGDFVDVHLNLQEKNTGIGALSIQFDYDETYLEIVPVLNPSNPDNLFFDCPYNYEEHGFIYASNEKNMKFAMACWKGVQTDGLFLTIRFRVIRDIPAGHLVELSGEFMETVMHCEEGDIYTSTQILSGGVMGTDYVPDNNYHKNDRTGIEAFTNGDDSINNGDFVTRLHGTDGQKLDYDIGFVDGETTLQPDDNVTVRLPLPENFDPEKVQVFHEDDNGNKTEMNIIVREDYIVLETDGFSRYTVVDPTKQAGEYVEAPELIPGDVNGDTIVDSADALEILKSVVGKIVPDADQRKSADVSNDKKIGADDALLILKRMVIKIDKFPVEA